jgi:hypothetical protein
MSFAERNMQWLARKERRIRESLERKKQQETVGCTFKPKINNKHRSRSRQGYQQRMGETTIINGRCSDQN